MSRSSTLLAVLLSATAQSSFIFIPGSITFGSTNGTTATLNDIPEDLALVLPVRKEYSKSGFHGAMTRLAELQQERSNRFYADPAFIAAT